MHEDKWNYTDWYFPPVFPPSLTSPEVSFLIFWTEPPLLGCQLQDGGFLKAAPRVSPGWGPRYDLCKAALVTEYALPVFEITSVRTEAGSGRAGRYVFIQCCLSPEVAVSPWVLQVGSRSGSIVPKVSATQRHCRTSQFPPSSSRCVINGSGISLLLIMEDLASSFSQVLFFPLWRTISLLCALSRMPLISAVYREVHECTLHGCYTCHSLQHSDLNNFGTPNPQPSIGILKHFSSWQAVLHSCEVLFSAVPLPHCIGFLLYRFKN